MFNRLKINQNRKPNSARKLKLKEGCLTCKARKKKCSLERPICSACKSLGRECIWFDYSMSRDSIIQLRSQAEEQQKKFTRKKRKESFVNADQHTVQSVEENLSRIVNKSYITRLRTHVRCGWVEMYLYALDDEFFIPKKNFNELDSDAIKVSNDFHSEDNFGNSLPGDHMSRTISVNLSSITDNVLNILREEEKSHSSRNGTVHYDVVSIPNFQTTCVFLYDYYCKHLSNLMSIVSEELNYYQTVFLPIASVNKAVLFGIISWSAIHLGGEYTYIGKHFINIALKNLQSTVIRDRFDITQNISGYLIICGASICNGDVEAWPRYLKAAAHIINQNGGLLKLRNSQQENWMISSLAYHDILSSCLSERDTFYPIEEYNNLIVRLSNGVDPLQGVTKPLVNIIGQISRLFIESKDYPEDETNHRDQGDIDGFLRSARKIKRRKENALKRANNILNNLNAAKPNQEDLQCFKTNEDLELQLTLFETFQLCAKLHLRYLVFKQLPNSIESEIMLIELLQDLEIVLNTKVEGALCMPLFIAGVNCCSVENRRQLNEYFKSLAKRHGFKNMDRARHIMEIVWNQNDYGNTWVDWFQVISTIGWDLSFA